MTDELLNFNLPTREKSIIKVIGVGGGGGNAVNHMYKQGIKDVDFIVCNTDRQALAKNSVPIKIQIGTTLTEGLGAGNSPESGRAAAIENIEDVKRHLINDTKMVFITAGMGGGTGTGAAPIIAEAARELGILTIAIVTLPFKFEGNKRLAQAALGIEELKKHVDSLIVIDNNRLTKIYKDLKSQEAFSKADNVLTGAAKGIAEMITVEGIINVDFADVRTVMHASGVAMMGTGTAEGEDRAMEAAKASLNSPLLNSNDIRGAKNILLNIGWDEEEALLDELTTINEYIQEAAGNNANLIWGHYRAEGIGKKILVTVVATGFDTDVIAEMNALKKNKVERVSLEDEKPTKGTSEEKNSDEIGIKETKGPNNKGDNEDTPKPLTTDFPYDSDKDKDKEEETVKVERVPDRILLKEEALQRAKSGGLLRDNLEYKENQPSIQRYNVGSESIKTSNQYSDTQINISNGKVSFQDNNFLFRRPD